MPGISAIPPSLLEASSSALHNASPVASSAMARLGDRLLELQVASGDPLDVRQFSVRERLSSLFQIDLVAVSHNPSLDLDEVAGHPASFRLRAREHERSWSGLCNHIEQIRVEPSGLSTYQLSIVPTAWLLTQRKNYRMCQQITEPDIVLQVLEAWEIEPEVRLDAGAYKKRKYRVQYAESDFAFISRMLEDAGIAYCFEPDGETTRLVLSDAPHATPPRAPALTFLDDTTTAPKTTFDFVTNVRLGQRVRPGKYTMRDHDYRRPPSFPLLSTASGGRGVEEKLERFQYTPGAFLFGTDQGERTPVADDKGIARTDMKEAASLAQRRLDAKRGSARVCTFETNAHDLHPGVVITVSGHPHAALSDGKALLVVESSLSGTERGEWSHRCEARGTDVPFRPALTTPRPTVKGVESATVVGPKGEEIHTDEFGRVRVHFHWDRESTMDENSSCWLHVSQPWGGAGYGGVNLPRIGQEVLVDFFGGDPDRPVIVGRMFTNLQKVPYKLPANKTQSGWRSSSTGGGGGYNEILFEDASGKELVNIQAQKDMTKLVKNDESSTVGRDRVRIVKRNEDVTVGKSRALRVVENESLTTGLKLSITAGVNRTSTVGFVDATTVGEKFTVTVSPPAEAPEDSENSGASATSVTMTDKKIVLTTGAGASITLEGDTITIEAAKVEVSATDQALIYGRNLVGVQGTEGDVVIQGGPMVHINP
jgi:type VI secretion system secreted protein VgrG